MVRGHAPHDLKTIWAELVEEEVIQQEELTNGIGNVQEFGEEKQEDYEPWHPKTHIMVVNFLKLKQLWNKLSFYWW